MNFTEFFIRRTITTTLLMAAISLFGLLAYFGLPVSDLPAIDFPTISVSASQPGASPETMANTVATPLEREFTSLQGISSINSSSTRRTHSHHACSSIFRAISTPPRRMCKPLFRPPVAICRRICRARRRSAR